MVFKQLLQYMSNCYIQVSSDDVALTRQLRCIAPISHTPPNKRTLLELNELSVLRGTTC